MAEALANKLAQKNDGINEARAPRHLSESEGKKIASEIERRLSERLAFPTSSGYCRGAESMVIAGRFFAEFFVHSKDFPESKWEIASVKHCIPNVRENYYEVIVHHYNLPEAQFAVLREKTTESKKASEQTCEDVKNIFHQVLFEKTGCVVIARNAGPGDT